jgi:hypothetical protein
MKHRNLFRYYRDGLWGQYSSWRCATATVKLMGLDRPSLLRGCGFCRSSLSVMGWRSPAFGPSPRGKQPLPRPPVTIRHPCRHLHRPVSLQCDCRSQGFGHYTVTNRKVECPCATLNLGKEDPCRIHSETFRWNPAGNQARPEEFGQQPEASLAWCRGNPACEA